MKRLISANSSDMFKMSKEELLTSIKASEGRTILSENIVLLPPVANDITNAEIAKAFGADLILLNMVDVFEPKIWGLEPGGNFVEKLHKLVGRPIGVNLEPVDEEASMLESRGDMPEGRRASVKTIDEIEKLGVDFVCLTGNPGTGVSNKAIIDSIRLAKKKFSGFIIAGKMHGAGVDEPVITQEIIEEYIEAGADVILVPSIGTIPGFDHEQLKMAVKAAHKAGALVMSAIGTSQEGSDKETIRYMAIQNKICGVDIQHIGDAGYCGLADPENIYEMSKAIRGIRHTAAVMAKSINR